MNRPLVALLLLAACSPASDEGQPAQPVETVPVDPAPPKPVATPSVPAPPAVDLAGEWRVAGIDGEAIDKPYGVALSADGERIWWDPPCAAQGRSYRITGNRFDALEPVVGATTACQIFVPEEVSLVWQALDAATTIERTPANGVLISGAERSVLLFSQ